MLKKSSVKFVKNNYKQEMIVITNTMLAMLGRKVRCLLVRWRQVSERTD